MVDANEKEPRSIRLLGLSECQRKGREGVRESEREGVARRGGGGWAIFRATRRIWRFQQNRHFDDDDIKPLSLSDLFKLHQIQTGWREKNTFGSTAPQMLYKYYM